MKRKRLINGLVVCLVLGALTTHALAQDADIDRVTPRPTTSDEDLRFWLDDMVRWHGFSTAEVAAATGLSTPEIDAALARFGFRPGEHPAPAADAPLVVLPYPGGRHPRIGFRDGAIDPQRETKLSVFLPWAPKSYVVLDVPEAVFSNLGLTYLAHTHVPTIWSTSGVALPPLEWQRTSGGFSLKRTLPEVATLESDVRPQRDGVRMRLRLTNLSQAALSELRVQICLLLKGAPEWAAQTNDNKVFRPPYGACRNDAGDHWAIMAWEPTQRVWGNAPCPCLHADPQFPDCPAGASREVVGWLSFYEGGDIEAELRRLQTLKWQSWAP